MLLPLLLPETLFSHFVTITIAQSAERPSSRRLFPKRERGKGLKYSCTGTTFYKQWIPPPSIHPEVKILNKSKGHS